MWSMWSRPAPPIVVLGGEVAVLWCGREVQCTGRGVLCYSSTVHWWGVVVVQKYSALVEGCCGTVVQWCCGTVIMWDSYIVVSSRSDLVLYL